MRVLTRVRTKQTRQVPRPCAHGVLRVFCGGLTALTAEGGAALRVRPVPEERGTVQTSFLCRPESQKSPPRFPQAPEAGPRVWGPRDAVSPAGPRAPRALKARTQDREVPARARGRYSLVTVSASAPQPVWKLGDVLSSTRAKSKTRIRIKVSGFEFQMHFCGSHLPKSFAVSFENTWKATTFSLPCCLNWSLDISSNI